MRKISARKPISAKALFWVLGFVSATIVFTAPDDAGSEDVGGVAKSAIDGRTLKLNDGRVIRLESIQTPAVMSAKYELRPWPLAEKARETLANLAGNFVLTIQPAAQPIDRYGRLVGQVKRPDGVWLQGELVKKGFARVMTTRDNHAMARELLRLEDQARRGKRGIWALEPYAPREPQDLDGLIDSFQIVEGTIVNASRIKGRVFLNFGQNWRDDFTVTIAPRDRQAMERKGLNPLDWKDKRVRVRGWITKHNGPSMVVDHEEQIEFPT